MKKLQLLFLTWFLVVALFGILLGAFQVSQAIWWYWVPAAMVSFYLGEEIMDFELHDFITLILGTVLTALASTTLGMAVSGSICTMCSG